MFEKGIETVTKYSASIDDSSKEMRRSIKSLALYMVEEFYYAALEIKQMEWARAFLKIISNKIPQSPKQMRLLAMFHEAI
jgi:hypothetical protein